MEEETEETEETTGAEETTRVEGATEETIGELGAAEEEGEPNWRTTISGSKGTPGRELTELTFSNSSVPTRVLRLSWPDFNSCWFAIIVSNFDIIKSNLDEPTDLREDLWEAEADPDFEEERTEGTEGVESHVKITGGISKNFSMEVDFDRNIDAKGEKDTKL